MCHKLTSETLEKLQRIGQENGDYDLQVECYIRISSARAACLPSKGRSQYQKLLAFFNALEIHDGEARTYGWKRDSLEVLFFNPDVHVEEKTIEMQMRVRLWDKPLMQALTWTGFAPRWQTGADAAFYVASPEELARILEIVNRIYDGYVLLQRPVEWLCRLRPLPDPAAAAKCPPVNPALLALSEPDCWI